MWFRRTLEYITYQDETRIGYIRLNSLFLVLLGCNGWGNPNEVDNFWAIQKLTMEYEALLSLYWFVVPCLDKNFGPTLERLLLLLQLLLEWHYQIEFPSYQQISTHFMTNFEWTLTIACLLSAPYWHLPSPW